MGLDFIGEINPHYSGKQRYILRATDFFTKWVESIPTRRETNQVIINFLEENILSILGFPIKLITYNAATFKSKNMVQFYEKHGILLKHSTPYYPQGNGLAESTNKTI